MHPHLTDLSNECKLLVPWDSIYTPPEFTTHSSHAIRSLAVSIAAQGLQGVLGTVRPTERGYELIHGFRRWLAVSALVQGETYVAADKRILLASAAYSLVPVEIAA